MPGQTRSRPAALKNGKVTRRLAGATHPSGNGIPESSLLIAAFEATADGLLIVDHAGKIVRFNDRFVRMWGIPDSVLATGNDDDALAYAVGQLVDPDAFISKVRELYANPESESFDVLNFKDGRVFERYSIPQRVNKKPVGRVWSFRDVTDRERADGKLEAEVHRAQRRLSRLDGLWHLIARSDIDRQILTHDVLAEGARALELTSGLLAHRDGDQLVLDIATHPMTTQWLSGGRTLDETLSGRTLAAGRTLASSSLLSDPAFKDLQVLQDLGLQCGIATPIRVGERDYVLSFADVSPRDEPFDDEDRAYVELLAAYFGRLLRLAGQEAEIARLAYHDPLTNLPNRARFRERLMELIPQSRRTQRRFALLYIDLDRFKQVNDTLGHAAGDRVLVQAMDRLRPIIREGEMLARLGGDEFAVLVPEISNPAEMDALARRMCDALVAPFRVEHHDFYLSASIGIALFPEDGDSADDLLAHVDAAMYRAKEEGRNVYCFYSEKIAERLRGRQRIQEGLRQALTRDELRLYFQPFVRMDTLEVVGAEALLRWAKPDGSIAEPGEFLAVAEESGLMVPIGQWVTREALSRLRSWGMSGKDFQLSVNVSAAQFADPDFLEHLASAVRLSAVDPRAIAIEITESVALQDPEIAQATLSCCRDMGLKVVLDDFGTYYSSLTYLKKLPVDAIKVDRTFVRELPEGRDDAAIAKSVIALGLSLGRGVIAEGVETHEQAAWLMSEGCTVAQGYLYGRPMPADRFAEWMALQQVHAQAV